MCCTEGILQLLDERELRGVLAHELAHVYNRDILIASVAATLAAVIIFVAQFAWLIPIGGRPRPRQLHRLNTSHDPGTDRRLAHPVRHQQVDGSTRPINPGPSTPSDPLALASALRKLEQGAQAAPLPPEPDLQSASALMITNPFRVGGHVTAFLDPPTYRRPRGQARGDGRLPVID